MKNLYLLTYTNYEAKVRDRLDIGFTYADTVRDALILLLKEYSYNNQRILNEKLNKIIERKNYAFVKNNFYGGSEVWTATTEGHMIIVRDE